MPAAFAPLVFKDCTYALHCPATGQMVCHPEDGFDPSSSQSPHLRFVVDWIGGIWAVDPSQLREDQAQYQRKLVELLKSDAFEDQNAQIAACVAVMPDSAIVFEMLEPPQGSFDGEIAYFGFDLARGAAEVLPQSVMLSPVEDIRSSS